MGIKNLKTSHIYELNSKKKSYYDQILKISPNNLSLFDSRSWHSVFTFQLIWKPHLLEKYVENMHFIDPAEKCKFRKFLDPN